MSAEQLEADERRALGDTKEVALVTLEAADEFASRQRGPVASAKQVAPADGAASKSSRTAPENLSDPPAARMSEDATPDGELAEFLSTTIVPSALMLLAGALLLKVNTPRSAACEREQHFSSHREIADALRHDLVCKPSPLVEFVEGQPGVEPRTLYNLACYYTRVDQHQKAKLWLERAVLQTAISERKALLQVIEGDPTLEDLSRDAGVMSKLRQYLPRPADPPAGDNRATND
ncbi:MAG TPA: hypothetical protein VNY52_12430 [Solirubrobacteraceae bacterium]|nr:hypothetical protein [Solirubrobacteraceae bacterium]